MNEQEVILEGGASFKKIIITQICQTLNSELDKDYYYGRVGNNI